MGPQGDKASCVSSIDGTGKRTLQNAAAPQPARYSPVPKLRAAAVVKVLFPKHDELPHWRLRDIADRLGLHPGSQVADVGCGAGEIALVWSRAVGATGHVWAEDIDPHALRAARKLMKEHRARNVTVL